MKTYQSQRGMTAIGWVLVLMMIGVVTMIVLKLVPIYLDGFNATSVVEGLKTERGIGAKTPSEIQKLILRRMDVNMVDGVTKDDIYISRGKGQVTIEVEYEIRERMFGNLDVVVSFNKSVSVPSR